MRKYMRRAVGLALGSLFLLIPAAQAAAWDLQWNGTPGLAGVTFYDTLRGWAVGTDSTIMRTADGGATWTNASVGTYDFSSVEFVSPLRGWAAGFRIYATTNGGLSWTQQANPAAHTLEDILFLSATEGWAVGQAGAILHTVNGGAPWSEVSGYGITNWYAIDFVSPSLGWIAGYGALLKTTNGGATWATAATDMHLYGMDFVDAQNGWVVGKDQKIWRTVDGGTTWTQQHLGAIGYDLLDVLMVNLAEGWAVGRNGYILHTEDGGATWAEDSNPAAPRHMYGLAAPDGDHVWAVGQGFSGQQGAVVRYVRPGAVAGQLWMDGRQDHAGIRVDAVPDAGTHMDALTSTQGVFQVDAPISAFTLQSTQTFYLAAQRAGMVVTSGQTQYMATVTLAAGDADNNGVINTNDPALVLAGLHAAPPVYDINGDGQVNILDAVLPAVRQGAQGPQPWPTRGISGWIRQNDFTVTPAVCAYDAAGRYAPDAVMVSNGLYRMYYTGTDGTNARILSMVSTNGRAWAIEDGVRVAPWALYVDVFSPHVIKIDATTWRMYFSARTAAPVANIHSAVSSNGLDWVVETGQRVSHGGPYDTVAAQSPAVFRHADGTAVVFSNGVQRMFYTGHDGTNLYLLGAQSADGIDWHKGFGTDLVPTSSAPFLVLGRGVPVDLVADPEVRVEADGSFRVYFQRYETLAVDTGATHRAMSQMQTFGGGSYSGWSADGADWAGLADLVSEITPGLGNDGDVNGNNPGAMLQIGNLVLMLTSSRGPDNRLGLSLVEGFREMQRPVFGTVKINRRTVAQVEFEVPYNLEPLGVVIHPMMSVNVLRDGQRLPNMFAWQVHLTNQTGVARVQLDYLGYSNQVSDEYEIFICHSLVIPPPDERLRGVWVSQHAQQLAQKLVQVSQMQSPGWLFATKFAQRQNRLPTRAPEAPAAEDEGEEYVYSLRNDALILWQPGAGGELTIKDFSEANVAGGPAVPRGPYFKVGLRYSYYNVWNNSAVFDAELYNNSDQLVDQFAVQAPTLAPTYMPSTSNGTRIVTRNFLAGVTYTNKPPRDTAKMRLVMRVGEEVIAEAWVPRFGGSPLPYTKSWNPLAQVTLYDVTVTDEQTDQATLQVEYGASILDGAPVLPSISVTPLNTVSQYVDTIRSTGFPAEDGLNEGVIRMKYVGDGGQTAYTRYARVRAVVDGLIVADQQVALDKTWTAANCGMINFDKDYNAVFVPIEYGAELWVTVQARYWSHARASGRLRLEIIAQSNVCAQFQTSALVITSQIYYANAAQTTTSDVYLLKAFYTGTATNFYTDGFRVVLEDPATGRVVDHLYGAHGQAWNPGATGGVASITVTPLSAYQSRVEVTYTYHSVIGEEARLMVDWPGRIRVGPTLTIYPEYEGEFTQAFPQLHDTGTSGWAGVTFDIMHIGTGTITSEYVRATILAGSSTDSNSYWREVGALRTDHTNRVWTPPPHWQIQFRDLVLSSVGSTRLQVPVQYRLKEALPGRTYQLRVEALRNAADTNNPVSDIVGYKTITDPGAAVSNVVQDSVQVSYTGTEYYVRTLLFRATILSNGIPAHGIGNTPICAYERYPFNWNTHMPGVIRQPVFIPIASNEAAIHAEYEIDDVFTNLIPVLELYNGGERLYPHTNNLFSVVVSPTNISCPTTNGVTGAVFGRITYNGPCGPGEHYGRDMTLLRLSFVMAGTNGQPTGQIVASATREQPYHWMNYDTFAQSCDYAISNVVITRPDTHRVTVQAQYASPNIYQNDPDHGPILKAYLWSSLRPLFVMPEQALLETEDSGDESGLEDHQEILFTSAEFYIGSRAEKMFTTDDMNNYIGGPQLDPGTVPPRFRPRQTDPSSTNRVPCRGTMDVNIDYVPLVGSNDVQLLSIVFYTRDGHPFYSHTVPIPAHQQAVVALDQVSPVSNGKQLFHEDTRAVANQGEVTFIVTYVINKANPADPYHLILLPFPQTKVGNQYYPLELVDIRHFDRDAPIRRSSPDGDGQTAAGLPYLIVTNPVGAALYKFRLADFDTHRELDIPMRFAMGPFDGQTVRLRASYSNDFVCSWNQLAGLRESPSQALTIRRGDYENQVIIDGVRYRHGTGAEPENYLYAVALTNGVPIEHLRCRPGLMDQTIGTNYACYDEEILMEFDFADWPTNQVTADQVRLYASSVGRGNPAPGVIGQRLVTLDHPITWLRPLASVTISNKLDNVSNLVVTCHTQVKLPTNPDEQSNIFGSLREGEYLGLQVRALRYYQDLSPTPLESEVKEITGPADRDVNGQFNLSLVFVGDPHGYTKTTQLGAYLDVYRAGVPVRHLAYTVVDYEKLWVNLNSFIVAHMPDLTVFYDGDDAVRGMGEDMFSCIGVTADEMSMEVFKGETGDPELRQAITYPIESSKEARWIKVDAGGGNTDTLYPRLPLYIGREASLKDGLGMSVMMMDDDTIPSFVFALIKFVFEVASQIAIAYGQDYLVYILDFIENFVLEMLAKDAMTDQLGTAGTVMTRALGWGVGMESAGEWDPYVLYYNSASNNMAPSFRTDRIVLPTVGKRAKVTLVGVTFNNDSEPWDCGDGEAFINYRIWDGLNPMVEGRIPEHGTKTIHDGYQWVLNQELFNEAEVGPVLYIEMSAWEEDCPDIGNDNDDLGNYSWMEFVHEPGYPALTNLWGESHREGSVGFLLQLEKEP